MSTPSTGLTAALTSIALPNAMFSVGDRQDNLLISSEVWDAALADYLSGFDHATSLPAEESTAAYKSTEDIDASDGFISPSELLRLEAGDTANDSLRRDRAAASRLLGSLHDPEDSKPPESVDVSEADGASPFSRTEARSRNLATHDELADAMVLLQHSMMRRKPL